MKKKILIIVSLILLFLASAFAIADGIKGTWTIVPVRGKIMWVESQATQPIMIRWDYYTLDDKGNMVVKAPGAYPGAFDNKEFYDFYVEEFPIQPEENFILPRSVYNFYVKAPSEQVNVDGLKITITD
ncbi:MAG: hypothetical protein ACOCV8_05195 [Spirochaetota bacterium]